MKTALKLYSILIFMIVSFNLYGIPQTIPSTQIGHQQEKFHTKETCKTMKNDIDKIAAQIKKLKASLAHYPSNKTKIAPLQDQETNLEDNYKQCEEDIQKKK